MHLTPYELFSTSKGWFISVKDIKNRTRLLHIDELNVKRFMAVLNQEYSQQFIIMFLNK